MFGGKTPLGIRGFGEGRSQSLMQGKRSAQSSEVLLQGLSLASTIAHCGQLRASSGLPLPDEVLQNFCILVIYLPSDTQL